MPEVEIPYHENRRCHVCLSHECGGTLDCDCSSCKVEADCPKVLHPTIRITRLCTQKCSHCCYSCSPDTKEVMSLDVARDTAMFLKNNHIQQITIMGGEFFCHPQWQEVCEILVAGATSVRFVSNSDWAADEAAASNIVDFFTKHPHCRPYLSCDHWHTNAHVAQAQEILAAAGIRHYLADAERENNGEALVPAGRNEFDYGLYSSFSCWCKNPAKWYKFLITEEGDIHKCPFGGWVYDSVEDYLDGGFALRFREFTKLFIKTFIGSCRSCRRSMPPLTKKVGQAIKKERENA